MILDQCRLGEDFCETLYKQPEPDSAYRSSHKYVELKSVEEMFTMQITAETAACVELLYRVNALRRNDAYESLGNRMNTTRNPNPHCSTTPRDQIVIPVIFQLPPRNPRSGTIGEFKRLIAAPNNTTAQATTACLISTVTPASEICTCTLSPDDCHLGGGGGLPQASAVP
jgi:hypothetical protein